MSFWKASKDKAALARVQDEAFHEQAYGEIQSGWRRDGLWAKAIIDTGGNEVNAKVTYLRLLVSAIRDEHYLACRQEEELAAQLRKRERSRVAESPAVTRPPPTDPVNSYDEHGRTPLMNAVLAADIASVRELLLKGADASIKDDNFGTSTALDMAALAERRAKSDEDRSVRQAITEVLRSIGTI